ncbi:hypothetical protein Tco_0077497 [Tanacetum coccineum]
MSQLHLMDPAKPKHGSKLMVDPCIQLVGTDFEFQLFPINSNLKQKLTNNDVRERIYREMLEYHPQMMQEYLHGEEHIGFMYPSGIDRFKEQFADLEEEEHKEGKKSLRFKIIAKIKIMVDVSQIAQERHSVIMILLLIPVVIIGQSRKRISQLLCVREMHRCIYAIHVDPVFEDPVIVKLEQNIKDLKLHVIDLFPSYVVPL